MQTAAIRGDFEGCSVCRVYQSIRSCLVHNAAVLSAAAAHVAEGGKTLPSAEEPTLLLIPSFEFRLKTTKNLEKVLFLGSSFKKS